MGDRELLRTKHVLYFFFVSGVMLLYLSCVQIFIIAFIYLIPLSNTATFLASIILMTFFLVNGYVIHFKDIAFYIKWLEYLSPNVWLFSYLLNRELSLEAVTSSLPMTLCKSKQVLSHSLLIKYLIQN